jgi:hypothetical protein
MRAGGSDAMGGASAKPPSTAAVKMTRGPVFLASFAGTWRFSDAGNGRTRVPFKYFYRLRWPFGIFAERIDRAFGGETAARLDALRAFVSSTKAASPVRRGRS